MPRQQTHGQEPSRPRRWLRAACAAGAVVLLAALTLSGTAQDDTSAGSRFFRLPGLFRSNAEESTPAPPKPDSRILRRVRQLMSDAQQLESSGHVAAALDMAQRADSVLSTATRTAGLKWPAGERSPAEYAAALQQKLSASRPTIPQPPTAPVVEQPQAPLTSPPTPVEVTSPRSSAATPPSDAPDAGNGFLLNWGDRAGLATAPPQRRPSADGGPIQLLNAGRNPTTSEPASDAQPPTALLNRLRGLDTWDMAEKAGTGEIVTPATPRNSSPAGGRLPAIGGWQREISDGNVGPIPTQPPHDPFENTAPKESDTLPVPTTPGRLTVEGPTYPTPATPAEDTTTPEDPFIEPETPIADTESPEVDEPAGPQPTEVVEPEPQPTEPVIAATTEPLPPIPPTQAGFSDTGADKDASGTSLLMSVTIQVLATFVGVLLAILVFRSVAIRIWGPGMGIVVPVAQTATSDSEESADADVVPFSGPDEADSESEMKIPDPASVPFRLVGSSYEDERLAEEQAEKERDQAILKTVFEQNVELIDELHDMRKSA